MLPIPPRHALHAFWRTHARHMEEYLPQRAAPRKLFAYTVVSHADYPPSHGERPGSAFASHTKLAVSTKLTLDGHQRREHKSRSAPTTACDVTVDVSACELQQRDAPCTAGSTTAMRWTEDLQEAWRRVGDHTSCGRR